VRRRRHPARAGSRRVARLAAGLFANLAGDIIYSLAPDLDAVPVPSASEPFWLAIYPCLYVAVIALIRSRIGRTLWATRVDGLVGGLAIAALLACVTVSAAVDGSQGAPFWESATNLAYPVGDLVLLGAIVSAVGLAGWRIDRLWGTLAAAIIALVTADVIYMTGLGGDPGGVIADALIATGMVGFTWAAALASPAPGMFDPTPPIAACSFRSGSGRSRSRCSRSPSRCTSTWWRSGSPSRRSGSSWRGWPRRCARTTRCSPAAASRPPPTR
jgi:hypothetical protein